MRVGHMKKKMDFAKKNNLPWHNVYFRGNRNMAITQNRHLAFAHVLIDKYAGQNAYLGLEATMNFRRTVAAKREAAPVVKQYPTYFYDKRNFGTSFGAKIYQYYEQKIYLDQLRSVSACQKEIVVQRMLQGQILLPPPKEKIKNSLIQLKEFIRQATMREQDEFFHLLYGNSLFKETSVNSILEKKEILFQNQTNRMTDIALKNELFHTENEKRVQAISILEGQLNKITQEVQQRAEKILLFSEKKRRDLYIRKQKLQENKLVLEKEYDTKKQSLQEIEQENQVWTTVEKRNRKQIQEKEEFIQVKNRFQVLEREAEEIKRETEYIQSIQKRVAQLQQIHTKGVLVRQQQNFIKARMSFELQEPRKQLYRKRGKYTSFLWLRQGKILKEGIERKYIEELSSLQRLEKMLVKDQQKEVAYAEVIKEIQEIAKLQSKKQEIHLRYIQENIDRQQVKGNKNITRKNFLQVMEKGTRAEKETLFIQLMDKFTEREEQGTRKNKIAKRFASYLEKQNITEKRKLIEACKVSSLFSIEELQKRLEEGKEGADEREQSEEKTLELLLYALSDKEFFQLEKEIWNTIGKRENSRSKEKSFSQKQKLSKKQWKRQRQIHSLMRSILYRPYEGKKRYFEKKALTGNKFLQEQSNPFFFFTAYKKNIIVDILKKGTLREQEEFIRFIEEKNVFTTTPLTVPNLLTVLRKGNLDEVKQITEALGKGERIEDHITIYKKKKEQTEHTIREKEIEEQVHKVFCQVVTSEKKEKEAEKIQRIQTDNLRRMQIIIQEQNKKIEELANRQEGLQLEEAQVHFISKKIMKSMQQELQLEKRRRGLL